MPSFEIAKKIVRNGRKLGQVRKDQSDSIMNETWNDDIQSKVAYIYDYYHDDEPLDYYPVHSDFSKSKTPIDIKFIVNAYNSENKDQVGYHIQFRPGQKCPLDYYETFFHKKYQAEFPVGLYIDIPDEMGIYRKWMITENANWLGSQFPTWYVLPIDHVFQWIYDSKKYQMCGVSRSQSSYNSGKWSDNIFTIVENQRKCILPMNEISATIYYDQRIAISAPIPKPIAWSCSKVEQTSPKGVNRLTFSQTTWDENRDYIEKDDDGNVIGIWCDYYKDGLTVSDSSEDNDRIYSSISFSGAKNPQMKIGGYAKTFTVDFFNEDIPINPKPGQWSFEIDENDVSDLLEYTILSVNQVAVRFVGDESFINKSLVVSFTSDTGIKSSIEMKLVGI